MSNNTLSIDEATTFDQIAEIREDYYFAEKRNGFNLRVLLTGGYKDPSHFILELIQNAEDALATEVLIRLFDDRLVFSHNGSIEFDLDDIKGITGIGNTTKEQEDNTIGEFGIGFKSVFTICKIPKIFSRDYCFELRNICVPHKIPRESGFEKGTHFVLPFESDEKSVYDIYRMLSNSIGNFNTDNLLFLTHINKVNLKTPDYENIFKKTKKEQKCGNFTYFECDINFKGSFLGGNKHLLFERPLKDNDKLYISIAYELNHDRKISMLEKHSKLFVFFPTEEETFLRFKVHGPYATTSTRESLSEKYAADNAEIMKQTVALYSYSLQCIKELGLVNVQFIESLPIIENYSPIYKLFYDETKTILSSKSILPTNDGSNISGEKACIVGLGSLTELLKDEDIRAIFKDREKWLDTNITYDRTRQLRDYLMSIGCREVVFETFIRAVQDDFFQHKDDEWLMEFYKIAGDNIKTMKPYLSKKFIRIENDEMRSPFVNSIKNVYLPSSISISNTIKKVFCDEKNEQVLKFFYDIGLEPPSIVDEIRQFLGTLKTSKNEEDYLVNLKLISEEYTSSPADKRVAISKILKDEFCILCEDEKGSGEKYAKPEDVFIGNDNIRTIYKNITNIYYLTKHLFDETNNDVSFKEFLINIGVNNSIKLINNGNHITNEEVEEQRIKYNHAFDINKGYHSYIGFNIDKIDLILANINENRSLALWNSVKNLDSKYFKAEFIWQFHERAMYSIDSFFIIKLQKSKWLYNDRNELVSPFEIYYEDVCKRYPDSKTLKEAFNFKPDARKDLPKEQQHRLELTDGLPIEFIRNMRKKYFLELERNIDFNPVDIDECSIPITEEAFINPRSGINESDLSKAEEQANNETEDAFDLSDSISDLYDNKTESGAPDSIDGSKFIVHKDSSEKRKKIGEWGEKLVFKKIKDKYICEGYHIKDETENSFHAILDKSIFTVTRHNDKNHNQPGYDITINKDDETIEYIEVKSDENEVADFNISGPQWEFSKTLALRGEGEKYSIYFVLNVGKKEAKTIPLRNPYQAWLDGIICADPIRVRVPGILMNKKKTNVL